MLNNFLLKDYLYDTIWRLSTEGILTIQKSGFPVFPRQAGSRTSQHKKLGIIYENGMQRAPGGCPCVFRVPQVLSAAFFMFLFFV